jgi:formylglycine-generating enzyme
VEGYRSSFAGGNDINIIGWTEENSGGELQLVGQKRPNGYGLYDMSGNVWEWTWDKFGTYNAGISVDPMGPEYGEYRVRRGGAVDTSSINAHVAFRVRVYPDYRSHSQGIRLVRTAPTP